ncbi:hypothetical protein HBI56_045140 [Parastagonospora nodorum]|uniref:Uncharacterized protein n=1 Tax=Phaeosphaeria nodorum (strain SN15 / ATCC MYA-4574 / FGSC 10173) TaxID=321614 RepID=A0A7U2ERF4_PHANO|nr:hypothetical protein HBH56_058260 [Parastagonospora nodorum]QRC91705.1 hypothetical protein JI435_401560 [Parastagonospora nodorum SN15]KAH3930888.1 hypothetical protein HBH54_102190 [Parastagonospora nodorum]KAH4140496.1 hypothetical protein HBH45_079580 [Parastagonospora nodorum]KAH4168000.1 hypothetical protein HBH44_055440 [Parastagonospora nodorum]
MLRDFIRFGRSSNGVLSMSFFLNLLKVRVSSCRPTCDRQSVASQTAFVYTLGLGLWLDAHSVRVLNSNSKLLQDTYISSSTCSIYSA